jgi:hypothetical protein
MPLANGKVIDDAAVARIARAGRRRRRCAGAG